MDESDPESIKNLEIGIWEICFLEIFLLWQKPLAKGRVVLVISDMNAVLISFSSGAKFKNEQPALKSLNNFLEERL